MTTKKILVIDDETDICSMLKDYLQMEGYLVYTAENGTEALSLMNIGPDLILLDINMPGMDGYQVCERIREHIHCPIIFLSARIEDADRIKGFRSGGDDYVTKPFSMDELIARIEAHLRREERRMTSSHVYMNGHLTVDFDSGQMLYDNTDIGLTKTEFLICEFLITHAGCVFDKEQIYENVIGFDGEADASIIMEHVRRIRKKIKKFTDTEYIETVWGVGYKWI